MQSELFQKIRVKREKEITEKMQIILFMEQLLPVVEKTQTVPKDNYLRSILEGRAFRLTEKLFPQLFKICRQVLDTLQFDEPVEFFVINDPAMNASAIMKQAGLQENIVVLNSALIEKLDEDELKFIIGHEMGHLIYKTVRLDKFFHDLYPTTENVPIQLLNLYYFWKKLSELSADRIGFLSSPDLKSAISVFFKLSAGVQLNKHDFNFNEYLKEIDRTLEQFIDREFIVHQSHPINPLRVKALKLFSESKLFTQNQEQDQSLVEAMDELLDYMQLYPDNELDFYRTQFILLAGVFYSSIDSTINKAEVEIILENLSLFYLFPRKVIDKFLKNLEIDRQLIELMLDVAEKLLSIDPRERYPMLQFLVQVMIADKIINEQEIEFLFYFSSKILGFNEIECSRIIMDIIQKKGFQPPI